MYLFFFILILVALIVVHEFGHFSVAKLFGIKVEEFGIGFPPRLWSVRFGETLYSLNLLFFGGFVRIFGEHKQEGENSSRSFSNKPRSVQAAVIAAGIVCNIIFAWLVLSVGYMVGLPTTANHEGFGTTRDIHTTVIAVVPNSPAQKTGILEGDVIKKIQTGTSVLPESATSQETQDFIGTHQDESFVIDVLRNGEEKVFVARAEAGVITGRKALGVQLGDVGILSLPVHLAVLEGALLTWHMTISTAEGLVGFFGQMFHGAANFADVAGPIGIAGVGSRAVAHGFSTAITLTALISINLALINVLPIPGLDGGRLFLIALEAVRRRALSDRATLGLTITGFAFLIGLMLLVSYHDILKLIG